jgi:hypothetical protein
MDWRQAAAEIIREIAVEDLQGHDLRILEPQELGVLAPPGVGGWFGLASYELAGCDPADVALLVVDPAGFTNDIERIGAALHEFAHWLDWGRDLVKPEKVLGPRSARHRELLELRSRLLAALAIREMEATPAADSDVPRWEGHEQRFVLAAAVLSHRAGEIIEAVRPRHLKFSSDYTGVTEGSWLSVLGDTVTRSGAIGDILDAEHPAAFVRAWQGVTGGAG